jgi:hypothetical protein
MYASVNHQPETKYQKVDWMAVALRRLLLKVVKGEVVVCLPILRVAIWRMKMKRLDMKKSKALIPAGPSGNHDQKRSVNVSALIF